MAKGVAGAWIKASDEQNMEKTRERETRGRGKGRNVRVWGRVVRCGVEKVGNGISRARVEDKMAGTLGAFRTRE